MKKFLSIMLVIILSLSCVFVLASCGSDDDDKKGGSKSSKPNSSSEKAAEALADAGYDVEEEEDDGYVLIIATKGISNHIEIYYCDDEDVADEMYERVKEEAADFEDEKEEMLSQLEEALGMADQYGVDIDSIYEMMGIDPDEIDDLKNITVEYGKDGKIVWIGTPAAIKAAK